MSVSGFTLYVDWIEIDTKESLERTMIARVLHGTSALLITISKSCMYFRMTF